MDNEKENLKPDFYSLFQMVARIDERTLQMQRNSEKKDIENKECFLKIDERINYLEQNASEIKGKTIILGASIGVIIAIINLIINFFKIIK